METLGTSKLGPPGLVLVGADSAFPFYLEDALMVSRDELRVTGRFTAGEAIFPGRLIVLVGGVLMHATLPLPESGIVGVSLARWGVHWYELGAPVPVLRRGLVTIDGAIGADLEVARVVDGGTFVASDGELVTRGARFMRGAVELGL